MWCGFRPRWILIKRSDAGVENWVMVDTERDTYNITGNYLLPNSTAAEASLPDLDILSNGFKLRATSFGNTSTAIYIFAAFAEHPFKTARAR